MRIASSRAQRLWPIRSGRAHTASFVPRRALPSIVSRGPIAKARRYVDIRGVSANLTRRVPSPRSFSSSGDGTIVSVQLTYSVASLAHNLDMVVRQPHLYAVEVIAPQSEATLRYHIVATDAAGHQTRLPTVGEFQIPLVPQSSLSPDLRSLGIGIGLGASAGSLAVAVAIWAWRIRRKGSPPSKEP